MGYYRIIKPDETTHQVAVVQKKARKTGGAEKDYDVYLYKGISGKLYKKYVKPGEQPKWFEYRDDRPINERAEKAKRQRNIARMFIESCLER